MEDFSETEPLRIQEKLSQANSLKPKRNQFLILLYDVLEVPLPNISIHSKLPLLVPRICRGSQLEY